MGPGLSVSFSRVKKKVIFSLILVWEKIYTICREWGRCSGLSGWRGVSVVVQGETHESMWLGLRVPKAGGMIP